MSVALFGIGETAPWEWQEANLKALIDDRIPEGLHIDYKDSRLLARKDDCADVLTKQVSAFNNSDGGMIVIGLQTDTSDGKLYPKSLDVGVKESDIGKTWLVQVINSNLSPPVADLRVRPVELHGQEGGRVAYVIYVPRGTRAVQAKDLRYYHRVEDQSLPMRDYQVRDVNNRSEGPDLRLSFGITPGTTVQTPKGTIQFQVEVYVSNMAQTPAEAALFTMIVPERLQPSLPSAKPIQKHNLAPKMVLEYGGASQERKGRVYSWQHSQTLGLPLIFKELRPLTVMTMHLTADMVYQTMPHFEPFVWIAESPRMEPRHGRIVLAIDDLQGLTFSVPEVAKVTLDGKEPLDWLREA